MIYQHADYCAWWNGQPCTCGMTKLMEQQNIGNHNRPPLVEPKKEPPPFRCVFGWHLYRVCHGMYDDLCVDCTLCEATSYTSWFLVWVYKITGRLVS